MIIIKRPLTSDEKSKLSFIWDKFFTTTCILTKSSHPLLTGYADSPYEFRVQTPYAGQSTISTKTVEAGLERALRTPVLIQAARQL